MGRKVILILFILFLFCSSVVAGEEGVLILSFGDSDSIQYSHLNEFIRAYIYSHLKNIPGFRIIAPDKLRMYLFSKHHTLRDMEDEEVLKEVTTYFDCTYTIGGFFYINGEELYVSLNIRKREGGAYRSVSNKILAGKCDSLFPSLTLDEMLLPVFEEVLRFKMKSALLTVRAPEECRFYIDGGYFGTAPGRVRLSAGIHSLKIMHQEREICDRWIYIKSNENREIDIPVSVRLSIRSDKDCRVYLDGEWAGNTPYSALLTVGRLYDLKVLYRDERGKEIIVRSHRLSTKDYRDVKFFYPSVVDLHITGSVPFRISVDGEPLRDFPLRLYGISSGTLALRVILEDPVNKRQWIFHREDLILTPFESIRQVGLSWLDFRVNRSLCFIPSAAQFYNREPLKGGLVAGAFISAAASSFISLYSAISRRAEYDVALQKYNSSGIASGYRDSDFTEMEKSITASVYTSLGFAIGAGGVYLFSLFDGWTTMDKIHSLMKR